MLVEIIARFLSWLPKSVLLRALRLKPDVAHVSIMTEGDVIRAHAAIQSEILGLGSEVMGKVRKRHVLPDEHDDGPVH